MVSLNYWQALSEAEKQEYKILAPVFIQAVLNSDTYDGDHFIRTYPIQYQNGLYFMARNDSSEPFAGITSASKKVIITLQADAGQNYGR